MRSRFAIAAIFAILFATPLNSAQIISDVVVLNATINDGYASWSECGVNGEVYRHTSGHVNSIMRVSPDGSALIFALPDGTWPAAIAPAGTGLKILTYTSREMKGVSMRCAPSITRQIY
jgi:hypothetical protein